MGWGSRAGGAVAVVLALTAGYLTLDAYDVVPGLLTVEPAPEPAAPFPDAPGAVLGPDPAVVLPPLSDDAAAPSSAAVADQVAALAGDDRLGSRVGVLVMDRDTGELLGRHAPSAAFVPASTQKLFTAAAALGTLDPAATLDTVVLQDPDDKTSLVLRGGGDMLLAAGAGDPDATNGRAGLGDLATTVADKLVLSGTTTVTLRLDDSLFGGEAIPPSWDQANVDAGYAAPVAALAVDVARLTDDEYARRETDPALAAANTFVAALEKAGVSVTGSVSRGTAPSDATTLASVSSAPLRDVVDYFLEHSDNTITEVVGRLVAIDASLPGTTAGATKAVTAAVARLGVDTSGLVLADCSGLGEGSRSSPDQLGQVLRLLTDPAQPRLRTGAVGMPIAGLTGTLDDRYVGTDGAGWVRAKTGSLPNVTALSGTVVTADGRMLVFALLADRVPDGGSWGARVIFDRFVSDLADCGCQG
ncbi:D-alanyl-D-alanine carboxypeptidase/D-alanyl-D-alanine-endopeptidase (penicillin-binding protein 4) [Sediminihabitans luteus]|uniref:D-alanyl-D-alanine carboxypeptidase/D-alanyl-D-alanine-endopeptidase (Penicillin-binding protein 4) n=1 Tax=Sediminihabitans luteus TaxID=1138585 RepID=A0A2M9CEE1_9CELL|nr:D-alanyl-D-alanine carboxypeptidase/D-alanyl-D-alanine-endopeptidase [Sediminihabitans luteus]PJJ70247.1 D-alanyl-D-alanine carboxypeptidase/D-alanyl-D-alanine-endopeptidase (penicillin-binding protein 4) [Sediminihabitans luteus]GII97718.1 D-alanyl-D-alanine carboxypeptidase [Sediminihabitans luteus]